MSGAIAFKPDEAGGADLLAKMLTSQDEHTRCLGRAFASGIGVALQDWIRAEQRRGTESTVILAVVANLGVQHFATVAAQVLAPSNDAAAQMLMTRMVEDRLPTYMAAVRASEDGGAP